MWIFQRNNFREKYDFLYFKNKFCFVNGFFLISLYLNLDIVNRLIYFFGKFYEILLYFWIFCKFWDYSEIFESETNQLILGLGTQSLKLLLLNLYYMNKVFD